MVASRSLATMPELASATPAEPAASRADADARREQTIALLRKHLPAVWRFLRRLGLSPEDADDAAQDVFLVAMTKTDLILEGQERRYLFGIALRIGARTKRTQKSRAEKTSEDVEVDHVSSPTPRSDELLENKEARALLDRALAEMRPDVRTAFVLYELEQMTMLEIATLTDTPPGTVASRLRLGREQFREAAARLRRRR